MTLLAVPNVSEGRDPAVITVIADALTRAGAALLDTHSDADHNRTVYTLTGSPAALSSGLLAGARAAAEHIDMATHTGVHPCVGALDVAPFVHTEPADRGPAVAAALLTADRIGAELAIPVFLYGALSAVGATRAVLRRGGTSALAGRMDRGEVRAEFGPRRMHPRAGASLLTARPPLIALNFELASPAGVADARRIAAEIRDGGERGLSGLRAIGVSLTGGVAQVSTNIEDPELTRPATVLAAVCHGAEVSAAEIVGLPPARYFADFPDDLVRKRFRMLEEALPS